MKKIIFINLLLSLLFVGGCRDYDDPESFLYGEWDVVTLDSCAQIVIPNPPPVSVVNVLNNNGTFDFEKDGSCEFKSSKRKELSFGSEFKWIRSGDSILVQYKDGFSSKSQFIQYSKSKIEFNIDIPRVGLNMWYKVILER